MFNEDAKLAARELDLVLTTRDRGKSAEEQTPMCGIPYHSSDGYIARLIAKGYKVAICEQTEDPALAKGLVKRDIIRVVTPRHGDRQRVSGRPARQLSVRRVPRRARTRASRSAICPQATRTSPPFPVAPSREHSVQ